MIDVATDQGMTPDLTSRWGNWSAEIFADIFSVLMMGQSAVKAMVELELTHTAAMLKPRPPRYPSPIVRLELLAQTADLLELRGSAALGGIDPYTIAQTDDQALDDLKLVPHIVKATLETTFPSGITFKDLCDFRASDFDTHGAIQDWCIVLQNEGIAIPGADLRQPRIATNALHETWTQVIETTAGDSSARQTQRRTLAERAIALIAGCGEPGTRADFGPIKPDPELGANLADVLMRLE